MTTLLATVDLFAPSHVRPLHSTGELAAIPVHSMDMQAQSRSAARPGGNSEAQRAEQQAWMQAVAAGDGQAFRKLSERYLGPISGFAKRMLGSESEGEDVAQETFLRVWKDAKRYQPTHAVSSWIYRITHNLCIDRLRRRKQTSERISQIDVEERPSLLLAQKELSERVNEALQELPERQRTAICLVHYDGLSQAEAAEVLEVGVEALESLLSRARRSLRKTLAQAHADHATSDGVSR